MKNIRVFYLKIFSFLEVKFSIYLTRRVFVMHTGKKYRNLLSIHRGQENVNYSEVRRDVLWPPQGTTTKCNEDQ